MVTQRIIGGTKSSSTCVNCVLFLLSRSPEAIPSSCTLHLVFSSLLLYLHENLQPFGIAASTTTDSLQHRMEASSLLILILMVGVLCFSWSIHVDIVCSALGVSVLGVNIIFAIICTYVFLHSFGKRNINVGESILFI